MWKVMLENKTTNRVPTSTTKLDCAKWSQMQCFKQAVRVIRDQRNGQSQWWCVISGGNDFYNKNHHTHQLG